MIKNLADLLDNPSVYICPKCINHVDFENDINKWRRQRGRCFWCWAGHYPVNAEETNDDVIQIREFCHCGDPITAVDFRGYHGLLCIQCQELFDALIFTPDCRGWMPYEHM